MAAAAVKDWHALVELAVRHRVVSYVLERSARGALDLPVETERELRRAALLALAGVMRIDVDLRRIVSAFTTAGIPTMVLKGPVLARTIYPGPSFRPYGDIDLLIQDQHEDASVSMLLQHGYTEDRFAAEDARRERVAHLHEGAAFHRQFTSLDGSVLLDLHREPLQLGLRSICEASRWRRATAVPGLPSTRMLCPEDQVVQLSAHVHKHGFERLIWLKDLDVLQRVNRDHLDWDLVERVARDEGVVASVWYSLHLAHRLLAAPVPESILKRLRPSMPVRILYDQIWPLTRIANLNGFMRRRAVQLHAAESWRGVLPSLILMGRRRERSRVMVRSLLPF
jgi:hypothetical protein